MSCKSIVFEGALNLGCYGHCGDIELPILACQTGTHLVSAFNKGLHLTNKVFAIEGEPIVLNNTFNECSTVEFQLINPDGTTYCFDDYDSFCFQIKFSLHIKNELNGTKEYQVKEECK